MGPINKDQNPIPTKELYVELKILGEGKFKDGQIKFEQKNHRLIGTLASDNVIDGIYDNYYSPIKLKEITNGTTKVIRLVARPTVNNKDDFYRNDNKVILTGKYVSNDGSEIEVTKTINYSIETMYNNLTSSLEVRTNNDTYRYSDNDKPFFSLEIINKAEQFSSREYLLEDTQKSNVFKINDIPKFNGYQPEYIRAYYTRKFDNNFYKNIETIVYDKVGNTLEINNLTYNSEDWIINIVFEYPRESGKEHKSEELEMRGIYDVSAYNNDNFPELRAPTIETVIKKKIEYLKPTEYIHIYPNLDISASILGENARKIYDNEEYDRYDRYVVSWTPYDITAKTKSTTLSEDKSIEGDFLSTDTNYEEKINISDIVVNKSMKYSFNNKKLIEQILEEDSRIEVYDDETNQLIRTLNKEEIIKQEWIEYNFEKPIKHIKVKFINIAINNPENTITLYFFKEINNENLTRKIDRDTFEKIKYIATSLQMEIDGNNNKISSNRVYGTPRPKFSYKMNFHMENRSKYIEQGKYNGQDTSGLENEFIYKISHEAEKIIFSPSYRRFGLNYDEIKKYIKEIKFEDKHGMYVLNNMREVPDVPGEESVDYIKYKGIYFEYIPDDIPEESYVKVYNSKTNELIHTFTAEEMKKYNSRKDAFIYPNEIKAIRIEMNWLIYISNIMRVDENEVVKLEEKNNYLNNKNIILNNPEYSVIEIKDDKYSAPIQTRVYGSMVNSHATVGGSVDRPLNTYSVQKDVNQSVSVGYSGSNGSSLYPVRIVKKETILIKYPKEVKSVKINNIKASGNRYNYEIPPKIIGYEQFEKEGFQYLKVYIDAEKLGQGKEIKINSDIRIDPTIEKQSLYATIYHYNNFLNSYERSTKDIEDINSNGDFEENVGLGSMRIDVVTPDTVIMSQNLTNYNTKGDVTYGPNTGIIENNGTGNATVNINLTNRWSPTISNVKIIGRIPYKGNQTAISKKNLKSTFNTFLTGPIRIPAELTGKARIYYSEIESNNDIDINDTTYNWKEDTIENHNQINWENIKSFYIDLGDSTINAGSKLTFSYDIRVPVVNTFNEKSYATAAALFDFNTHKDGNIKSNAESDRVGVIFVKRYNLNISALIKGNKNPIAKSIYKIENYEEDDDKIVKTGETDSQGRAVVKDLRVNERYKLTEETTDSDYVVNKQSVDFTLKELDNGNLELEIQKGGNIVETSVIQPTETENATVNINMEYLQKYSLIINKLDKESRTPVKGATYILKPTTDNGESNISGSTNENGEVVFKGLIPKVNYTLEEKSSPKYYLNPRVKYEVSEVNGTYSINITEGEVENKELTQNNVGLNNSKITLLGEKIKTYAININKYEKGKNKKLSKAQFKLVGDGYENGKTLETNDDGIAKLEGLYEYREDKDYTAEYTVTEIIAPDGYKKSEGTLKFKVQRNSSNEMELKVLEDTLTKKNKSDANGNKGIRIENSIVNIDIENELLFKLIKKDGKTEERLSNTKFVIYKVNEDGTDEVALDIKGNKVGTLERDTNIPNGEGYVVATNEFGEISLALPEGKYKFIEIQAPDYKYDLPSSESERTYYYTIKDNKTTYKLVENENIKKVLKESYGPGEGEIDSTYVNGKTIHYKLDKEGEKYHLRFYDNKFNVTKDIELN
nr:prealbumin-like fold domain-containing protein [Clostridiales bacterium]